MISDPITRAYASILPTDISLPDMETVCCQHSQPSSEHELTEVFQGDRDNFIARFSEMKRFDKLHEDHAAEETPALKEYTSFSRFVNSALHNHSQGKPLTKATSKDLADAGKIEEDLSPYTAKQAFHVYTGVAKSPIASAVSIGGYLHAHLPAFASTSTDLSTAEFFAAHDHTTEHNQFSHHGHIMSGAKHVLRIHVVPGTNIASVKHFAKYQSENEMLLNRGYNVMINPRPTYLPPKVHGTSATYMWDTWLTHKTPKKLP